MRGRVSAPSLRIVSTAAGRGGSEGISSMNRRHQYAFVVAAVVLSAALAGCVQAAPSPRSKPAAAATATSTASATPTSTAAPTFKNNGSAADNKSYFDLVNSRLFTANGSANGRTIIDNLVVAGFIKKNMQVTPDQDAIGHAADSILFSVKIGSSCLLGQHGGAGYSSSVAPALTSGSACLIGKTRTIDW